jgi:hypothetical protein
MIDIPTVNIKLDITIIIASSVVGCVIIPLNKCSKGLLIKLNIKIAIDIAKAILIFFLVNNNFLINYIVKKRLWACYPNEIPSFCDIKYLWTIIPSIGCD